MNKVYTQIEGAYVFPDPEDLKTLKPDSCVVRKVGDRPCLIPLNDLKGKQVEGGRNSYSPLWGYQNDKNEPYILLNGERKNPKFCDLCRDRLNGITGNCFNTNIKPKGCSFEPSEEVKPFEIELKGWKKLRPTDVNKHSAFNTPCLSWVDFDPKTVKKNKKARIIARHLPEYQEKKVEKYCSRCIYQGTCYLNSNRVAEHCMVTEEEMIKKCTSEIRKKYGSVSEFLNLLAYGGERFSCRPQKHLQEEEWRVSQPLSRNKFLIVQPYRYFNEMKVSRKIVEKLVTPKELPEGGHEKIAALAWYYLSQYQYHRIWVSLKTGGIEVTHRTRGHYHFYRPQSFTSFNEIHYFFNR